MASSILESNRPLAMHTLQSRTERLGICRISKTNMSNSPFRNARHPAASTGCFCSTVVTGQKSYLTPHLSKNTHTHMYIYIYSVIHKSLRDFRPLRYSSRNGHAEGEHVNRGRDTPRLCPTLQVLDMSMPGNAADVNL